MSCGPKRIQLLSVSDHGSHCTLLLQEEMMTDSLLISRIPRICQKSHHPWFAWIFDEKLLWAPPVSSNVSSPLYHQMYHHVSRPPPPILIMLRIILLKHKLGEISKLEISGFLTKPFCFHPGKMIFLRRYKSVSGACWFAVEIGNWWIGTKEQRSSSGRSRFMDGIIFACFFPSFFVLIYGCPSPIYAMEYFLFLSKQNKKLAKTTFYSNSTYIYAQLIFWFLHFRTKTKCFFILTVLLS